MGLSLQQLVCEVFDHAFVEPTPHVRLCQLMSVQSEALQKHTQSRDIRRKAR